MAGRGSNIRTRACTMSMRKRCVRRACLFFTLSYVRLTWTRSCQGLFTSSDVLNSRVRSLITEGAEILCGSSALRALLEDEEVEVDLVLDVRFGNGPTRTSYYCVSHVERRIFWLEGIGHEEVDIPCTSNRCMTSKGSRVHCGSASLWFSVYCD